MKFMQNMISSKRSFFQVMAWVLSGLFLLSGCHQEITGVLSPKGIVTHEERILLFDALALMLIVVLPVIIMSFAFVYKYRQSHHTAEYKPNWCHSYFLEALWWGIPIIIIVILGISTWKATHKLDPYQRIKPDEAVAMHIKVIALPWKWLFIYPKENIAIVNELVIPKGKQIEFSLTADNAAMAAFFVPQISSQIYTMAGMRTKLHAIATEAGTFRGLNAQYNGDGFSDMHFPVHVVNEAELAAFVEKAKASSQVLSMEAYQALREPSEKNKVVYYAEVESKLFQKVIDYYMMGHPLFPAT